MPGCPMTRFARPELAWSAETEMSDLEATFWRAEVDPRLRSGGVVMDVLDDVPDWDRLARRPRRGASPGSPAQMRGCGRSPPPRPAGVGTHRHRPRVPPRPGEPGRRD